MYSIQDYPITPEMLIAYKDFFKKHEKLLRLLTKTQDIFALVGYNKALNRYELKSKRA